MKSFIRKTVSVVMICMMAFVMLGASAFAVPVNAASKTGLSKKSVTMTKGDTKTIRLKNVSKKVVWKNSSKKVVRIIEKKGKYKNKIKIKGLRKGKAVITAKVGKKKYKCKVTVKGVNDIEIRPLSASAVNKSKKYKRTLSGTSPANEKFRKAATDFSIDLFKEVSKADAAKGRRDSVLISPDSVATALAMLVNGAGGATLDEMKAVLGGDMDPADYCSYLAGLNDRLESKKKIIFVQSNSIWARKGAITAKKSFLQKNKNYFDADFYVAPFNSETVRDINNWVFNNTRNMIPEVINRLSEDDKLVLINTTVFEGKWAVPFDSTAKEEFTNADGSKKSVTMLKERSRYNYFTMDGARCFERRYRGGSLAFVGILPPEGVSVDSFIQDMSGSGFRAAWKSRESKEVVLTMPEFKYDYKTELDPVLKDMGMVTAFTDSADFSKMGTPPTKVDKVLHNTHIELDRYGTKAAAVTTVVMKDSSMPMEQELIEIRMNRPFVYAIVDVATGIPLFIGSIKKL